MLPRQSLPVLRTPYHQEDFAQYIINWLLLFATQTCSLLSWPTWLLKKRSCIFVVGFYLDYVYMLLLDYFSVNRHLLSSCPLLYSFYIGYPFFIGFLNTFTKWSTYFLKRVCQIRRVSSAERYQCCLYLLPLNYYLFECCLMSAMILNFITNVQYVYNQILLVYIVISIPSLFFCDSVSCTRSRIYM